MPFNGTTTTRDTSGRDTETGREAALEEKRRLGRVAALEEKKRRDLEEKRAAAELPEQPMRVGGGARVGAGTALAAAPFKPVTTRPAEGPPEPPVSVAGGEACGHGAA